MITPLDKLKFKGTWRDYQARVLSELDTHLDDDHLHVVAAPGSGKTVLGLEVMRRLNRPTLILAPTITIRNQWILRLRELFGAEDDDFDWISKDIYNPNFLTVITYQALLAGLKGQAVETESEELPEIEGAPVLGQLLKFEVVILDEAHHLRNEWWRALMKLKKELENPKIVSLTATPPYDVETTEWDRYYALCGPIDSEIPVPELVGKNDLCPHQDFIHFSSPSKSELDQIIGTKTKIKNFIASLRKDEVLQKIVSEFKWVQQPEEYIGELLDDPQFFSSLLIYLHHCEVKINPSCLKVLGVDNAFIPFVTPEWIEIMLNGIINDHRELFHQFEVEIDELTNKLKKIGLIERKRVSLLGVKKLKKILAASRGKLDSIVEIAQAEQNNLGDDLRLVILTDYIRKQDLPKANDDKQDFQKIGVIPIFEFLRRIEGVKLGVLTGSLVYIPKKVEQEFLLIAQNFRVESTSVDLSPLAHDENYSVVNIAGKDKSKMVAIMTELFGQGHITCMIGTQALLGEGWDSPTINTLILASTVGSFMLSNQMRGRAIRIDRQKPHKVANIWHLATVDLVDFKKELLDLLLNQPSQNNQPNINYYDPLSQLHILGNDMLLMQRRFRAFEGLSVQFPPTIENGIERLGISVKKWSESELKKINQNMLLQASNREQTRRNWEKALPGKNPKPSLVEKSQVGYTPSGLFLVNSLKALTVNSLMTISIVMGMISLNRTSLKVGLTIVLIYALFRLGKVAMIFMRTGTIEGSLQGVGYAVIESLYKIGEIKTHLNQIKVKTALTEQGIMLIHMEGGTHYEKSVFLKAIEEVLSPIQNPRYLLHRKSRLGFIEQQDFHPVPSIFSKKESAQFFLDRWNRYVAPCHLIYTRSFEGRRSLLKARVHAMTAAFVKPAKRISIWE